MAKQNLNHLISKALDNITSDRDEIKELLSDLKQYLSGSQDRYTEVGTVAAKYVETLQRSNEQLVKLAALVHKKDVNKGADSFSEGDKDRLFDLIQKAN
jgi:uncharacterized protein YukE|tara:strand:- start:507 stop:803 length:297 start_codon:yes stop_codon:yes gene_type:complete